MFRPDATGGGYSAPPDLLAGLGEGKGMERTGEERSDGRGGREGKEKIWKTHQTKMYGSDEDRLVIQCFQV